MIKKILKNMFRLLPVRIQAQIEYRITCGRKLNLRNPTRYSEKIQWYKLNYHDPLMIRCADKIEVHDFVKEKGLEFILNERFGVYDTFEQIDFNKLPNSFIIKSNNGSGDNIIIKDKNQIDYKLLKKKITKWYLRKKFLYGTEWVYKKIKTKILIEKLLPFDQNDDIPDYKFFCFNGKVFCMYLMRNYLKDHKKGELSFFDSNFIKLPYKRSDYNEIKEDLLIPLNFSKMVQYAQILSKDFPHVRVDFYNINGNIKFGELTFYTRGGYTNFEPDDFDYILGNEFILPNIKKV